MCCLTANPALIYHIPPPMGNVTHLGQIVRSAVNGLTYLIDVNGRSLALFDPRRPMYRITVPDGLTDYIVVPNAYPVPDPDDYPPPTYNTFYEISKRLWIFRNQDLLIWGIDFTLSFVGAQQRVYFVPSLNADTIEVHIHHHAAIPYELYAQDPID